MSIYTQEHDETLPDLATIWMDLKLGSALQENNIAALQNAGTPKVVRCPDSSTHANGYVYNSLLSGVGMGNSSIGDPTAKFLLADGWHTGNGVLNNVAFSQQDLDFRHSSKLISAYLDGHVGMQGPDFLNTCGLPATAIFFSSLPVPYNVGMGSQDFMIDTGAVTWSVDPGTSPADGYTITNQGGYKCTINFTKTGTYNVSAGSGTTKAITVIDYKISTDVGAPDPLLPNTAYNFTYANSGVPVTGTTLWEYRLQGGTWNTNAATGAVASITFPGVMNVTQVFEVRATNNSIVTVKTVNVGPQLQTPGDPVTNPSTYLRLSFVSASVPEGTPGCKWYSYAIDHEETGGQTNCAFFAGTNTTNTLVYSFGSSVTVTGLRIVVSNGVGGNGPTVAKPVKYYVGDESTGVYTQIASQTTLVDGNLIPTVTQATGPNFKVVIPDYGNDSPNYRSFRITEFAVYGTGSLWIEQPTNRSTTSTPALTIDASSPAWWKAIATGTMQTWLTGDLGGSPIFPEGKGDCIYDLGKSCNLFRITARGDKAFTGTISTADSISGPWTNLGTNDVTTGTATFQVKSIPGTPRYVKFGVTTAGSDKRFYYFHIYGTPVP